LISQAGEMERHGIPNDFLQNIDPIALIVFIPIMDLLVYPGLRKIGIHFRPITRIFCGFMLAAGAMAYTAGIQVLNSLQIIANVLASDLLLPAMLRLCYLRYQQLRQRRRSSPIIRPHRLL